jgi:hypothetical protein
MTMAPQQEGGPGDLPRVGNDVVDLNHPSCRDRTPGDSLSDRILSDRERSWIEVVSARPALWSGRLWALWASKETAFKAFCKSGSGHLVFRPRSLECRLHLEQEISPRETPETPIRFHGWVEDIHGRDADTTGGNVQAGPTTRVAVDGMTDGRWLHVTGISKSPDEATGHWLESGLDEIGEVLKEDRATVPASLRDRFTDDEWGSVHSVASAHVRLRVRRRLQELLVRASPGDLTRSNPAPDVEILTSAHRPGRTPPRVRIDGVDRPDIDLSLSHHGRFVAWAILLPAELSAHLPGMRLAESDQKPGRK